MCHEGVNEIGEYLERIYAVTFYCNQFRDHSLTNAIKSEVKQGEYAEEMADLVEWGIRNLDDLESADYIVSPPRGTDDADINHMKKIGEIVSSNFGIPLQDSLRKKEPYKSQKEIDDPEARLENVRDNISCVESFSDDPTVLLIDDVATSTGTLKYSAKALINSGASKVVGLTISRSEKIKELEEAKIYEEVGDDD